MTRRTRPLVLVTGASGLLGWSLRGEFGRTCDLLAPGLDEFDVLRRDAAVEYILGARPDLVVHAAAYTAVDRAEAEPEAAMAVNREGTAAVAEGARRAGAFLVYISTDYVFDGRKGSAYVEEDYPRPLGVYGRSKLEGEAAVRAALRDHLIARTAWIFGPGGPNFVQGMARRAVAGERVRVVHDQTGSPTYTPHLAGALRRLWQARARGIFHVVNAGSATWHALTREIYRLLGSDPALVEAIRTEELARPAARPAFSVLDASRMEREAGINLPTWREALAEYLGERGNWGL